MNIICWWSCRVWVVSVWFFSSAS